MIKRIIKIFKYLIISAIAFMLVFVLVIYFLISNRWTKIFSEAEMEEIALTVNESPKLTANFYEIYDKIHPNEITCSMNQDFLKMGKSLLFKGNERPSPCRKVFFFLQRENEILKAKKDWKDEYKGYLFGWAINDYSTPEKCFDYSIANMIACPIDSITKKQMIKYDITELGAHNSSLIMFDKNLEELNDDEILELIIHFEYLGMKRHNIEFYNQILNKYKKEIE